MAKNRHTSLRSLQKYAPPASTPSPSSPLTTTPPDAGADSPRSLPLEITETALMKDIAAAQRFAAGVAQLGCRLALDDFGNRSAASPI